MDPASTIYWIDFTVKAILWVIGIGVISTLTIVAFVMRKYRHIVVIRYLSKGRKIIRRTRARDYKDADGVPYWRLLAGRINAPVPPSEAIEITSKGRRWAECYLTEHSEVVWILDEGMTGKQQPKKVKDQETGMEFQVAGTFWPITTNHRIMGTNQVVKAARRKSRSKWEMAQPIVVITTLLIIITLMLVFWKSLAEPFLEMGDKVKSVQDQAAKITDKQLEIYQGQQRIMEDQEAIMQQMIEEDQGGGT